MNSFTSHEPTGKVTTVVLDSYELNHLVLKAIAAELGIDINQPDTLFAIVGGSKFSNLAEGYQPAAVCVRFLERKNSIHKLPRKP